VDAETPVTEGIVFVAAGAAGAILGNRVVKSGLRRAKCPWPVEVYRWSRGPLGLFGDLRGYTRNHRLAGVLSQKIADYLREHPQAAVSLVGVSAGCAIIAWALEALPAELSVRRVVFIGPALSPGYDLTEALKRVDREAVVFTSRRDELILGWGTTQYGTMDRVFTDSAGKVGFKLPDNATRETRAQYAKLREIAWTEKMLLDGHYGGHLGPLSTRFVCKYVAPIIMGE
jgi:pimeloyl-ACP methyl ester carboxylesterase